MISPSFRSALLLTLLLLGSPGLGPVCADTPVFGVDSILFTRDEPDPSMRWRGIRFVGAEDASGLEYCRIEWVRSSEVYPEVRGGAVYCELSSPTIRHCLMQYNESRNNQQNGMGGGVACYIASPTIEFCVIRHNEADSGGGIGVIEEVSVPIIRNNLIYDNRSASSGGGIYSGARSASVIENNIIIDNTAYGWGGGGITLWNWYAMNFISKTVRSNIVAGNWASSSGGGFYIRYDYSDLDNNTVADNTAYRGGGVCALNQAAFPPDLYNFIIWGNSATLGPSIYPDPTTGSEIFVSYSDVEGGWVGVGNLETDPFFADEIYQLDPTSPCIDSGNPDAADFDVCFPPSQGTEPNDMGAYGGPGACGWDLHDPAGLADDPREDRPAAFPFAGVEPYLRMPLFAGGGAVRVVFGLLVGQDARDRTLPARLDLIDLSGRKLRSLYSGSLSSVMQEVALETGGLAAGLYFVRLATPAGGCARRFVVLH